MLGDREATKADQTPGLLIENQSIGPQFLSESNGWKHARTSSAQMVREKCQKWLDVHERPVGVTGSDAVERSSTSPAISWNNVIFTHANKTDAVARG